MTITSDELKQDALKFSGFATRKIKLSEDLNIPQQDINAVLKCFVNHLLKYCDGELMDIKDFEK